MNNYPLVSIVIPTYSRPLYLKRCIESVLNQTYSNIEIFVVITGLPIAAASRFVFAIPSCQDGSTKQWHFAINEEDLYMKMKKLCYLSRDDREQMGKNGRYRMEEIFDKRVVVAETIRKIKENNM